MRPAPASTIRSFAEVIVQRDPEVIVLADEAAGVTAAP
jgi:hypothetical protein